MKISEMNWSQVESYLAKDDRAVLPTGSTEQHAQLSLSVDSILSERVSEDAAAPIGVPVFPAVSYGLTPYFMAFPGTVTLKVETFIKVIGDILDSLAAHGFRRIVIVNGHGGNAPAQSLAAEWMAATTRRPGEVPQLVQRAQDLEEGEGNRSRRLPCLLDGEFPLDAPGKRAGAGRWQAADGSRAHPSAFAPVAFAACWATAISAGYYQRKDEEMMALWQVAVDETREVIEAGWL